MLGNGIRRLHSGLSNKIYAVKKHNILIRVYGPKMDLLVDREREKRVINLLDSSNIGPKLLFEFPGGRVEELLNADPVKTHSFLRHFPQIIDSLKEIHHHTDDSRKPSLVRNINSWTKAAKERNNGDEFTIYFENETKLTDMIRRTASGKVVLCHNDLHPENILQDKDTNEIYLIDYEYADYNYYEYDLANTVNELLITYGSNRFSIQDIDPVCYEARISQIYHRDSPTEAKQLFNRLPVFRMASHYLWGMWGIIKASSTQKDGFPYKKYAVDRLELFDKMAADILRS